MTDARLTDELARRIGYRPFPNRFLTEGRGWIARSHFQPLCVLSHAFELLEKGVPELLDLNSPKSGFVVEARLDGRVGRATGEPKARTICLAVARALKLES